MKSPKLLVAVAAGLTLAVAGCGSDESESTSGAGGNGIDRAFAAQMVPHHESAIQMAEVARQRGESEFVKGLADDIVRTQADEIETLRAQDAELEQAGVKPGDLGLDEHMMGMDGDASMLENADPFDAEFIDMMIPHHQGAVEMAKVELDKGGDPELKSLAQESSTPRSVRSPRCASTWAVATTRWTAWTTDSVEIGVQLALRGCRPRRPRVLSDQGARHSARRRPGPGASNGLPDPAVGRGGNGTSGRLILRHVGLMRSRTLSRPRQPPPIILRGVGLEFVGVGRYCLAPTWNRPNPCRPSVRSGGTMFLGRIGSTEP